jgi:hypothetical protein
MDHGGLQVFKKSLSESQMSDAAYLDEAVTWSKDLTRMRTRSHGDTENAMRSIERDYGVDYWTLWLLRYRRGTMRTLSVSVYERLKAAYRAECERQMRKLQHEIEVTEKIAGAASPAVRAAKAALGEDH